MPRIRIRIIRMFYSEHSDRSRGFTMIEILVAVFLLGVATVAITGLTALGTRTAFENKRQNIAQALLNERLEYVRSLPYNDVGLDDATGDEPNGVLRREELLTSGQQEFTVKASVTLIDDPDNGTLPAGGLNEATADYKEVRLEASWLTASGTARTASATTRISLGGAPRLCTPGATAVCPGIDSPGEGACIPKVDCPASGQCPSTQATDPYCPTSVEFCPGCYTDDDCEAGQTCNTTTQTCVATAGACRTNADCAPTEACQSGLCVESCVTAGCSVGEVCNTNTGVCSQPCTSGTCDCPFDSYCDVESGVCETGTPPAPTPPPTPCSADLVGYWALDDGVASTVSDWSGNNNDGMMANGPLWSVDTPSTVTFTNAYSVQFDGENDYIAIPDVENVIDTSQGTFSVWIKMTGGMHNDSASHGVFGIGSSGDASNSIQLIKTAANTLQMQYTVDGNEYTAEISNLLTGFDDTWVHIAGLWDTDGNIKIYKDGVPGDTNGNRGGENISAGVLGTTRIGSDAEGPANMPFNGYVDDVRVYNRALTEAEITQLASGEFCEIPPQPPMLTGKDPLDDATDVPVTTDLTMTFSKVVNAGTGNVYIKKSSDGSAVQTIDVTSGAVSGSGTDTIIVDPPENLLSNTQYYINIDSGAFIDNDSLPYAGIPATDTTTWGFGTEALPACPVDLTGYWQFDEGSGGTAYDVIGNYRISNIPLWSSDNPPLIDYSLSSVDYRTGVSTFEDKRLDGNQATYAAWFKFKSGEYDSPIGYPIYQTWNTETPGVYMRFVRNNQNKISFFLNGYFASLYVKDLAVPTDEWVHYAVTYKMSANHNNLKTLKLYKNGVLIDSSEEFDLPVYIGDTPSPLMKAFGGNIDELRFYNRVLNQSEIQNLALGNGACQ